MCLIPVCTKNDFWWMNALLDQYGITNLINVVKVHALTWPTDLHESCTGVQDALIDRQLHPRHVLPGLMQHLLLHKDKQSITTVIKSQIQQSFISSSIVVKKIYFDRWYSLSSQCQLQAWVHNQICLLEKESCNVVYKYLSRIICLVVPGNWGFFVGVFFFCFKICVLRNCCISKGQIFSCILTDWLALTTSHWPLFSWQPAQ